MVHLFQPMFYNRPPKKVGIVNPKIDNKQNKIGKSKTENVRQSYQKRNAIITLGRRPIYESDLQAAMFALTLISTILIIYNFIQSRK